MNLFDIFSFLTNRFTQQLNVILNENKMTANNQQIQCIKEEEFDENNIVFLDKVDGSVGEGNAKISYCRVPIRYRKKDGTLVDFVVSTGKVKSYGVSANTDMVSKAINGYSLTCYLALGAKTDKKEAEKKESKNAPSAPASFIEKACMSLHKAGIQHMITHAEALGKEEFDAGSAKALLKSPISMPKDKTKKSKRIYPKLIWFKGTDKQKERMVSKFLKIVNFGKPGEPVKMDPVNPLECTGECEAIAAVKFDNIFVGAKIAFQLKVLQAIIMDTVSSIPDDLLAGEVAELQKGIHSMTLKTIEDKSKTVENVFTISAKKEGVKKPSKEEAEDEGDPEADLAD